MLSKVLTGTEAGRAQPAVFALATPRTPAPPAREPSTDAELHLLRSHIHRLESEIGSAKHGAFEAGKLEGEQSARAEVSSAIERMNASIAGLADHRRELRSRAEKDVIQLALLIAKRVLHRELNIDINALTALARVVFERLARAESYQVSVHPRFAPAIQNALVGQMVATIEIRPDPALEPGSFLVRSAEGVIDASVDTQLEEIGRGLMDRLTGI